MTALVGCTERNETNEKGNWYPMAGEVIGVNNETDVVTICNRNGVKYSFYGTEDYAEGDFVAVIMDDNGTPGIYDDTVIMAYYQG